MEERFSFLLIGDGVETESNRTLEHLVSSHH